MVLFREAISGFFVRLGAQIVSHPSEVCSQELRQLLQPGRDLLCLPLAGAPSSSLGLQLAPAGKTAMTKSSGNDGRLPAIICCRAGPTCLNR